MKTGYIEIKEKATTKSTDHSIVLPVTEPKWEHRSFEELKFRFLLINGPNLNMLGKRDPDKYGTFTLADVEKASADKAAERGFQLECFQSNHEGAIIDRIHRAIGECDGMVINPGAFTHYSYAISDAIELCGYPAVEVHISDISAREDFRKLSVTRSVCIAQVKGLGIGSYIKGIEILCDTIEKYFDRRKK